MKKKETQFWVPFFIDKWIFGSTRHELEPDERGVFVDLVLLAGKDEGFIRANERTPYPLSQLAGLLVISEELLKRTIEKCLRPEVSKLRQTPEGTLCLANWSEFNYSASHKRRLTREIEERGGSSRDTLYSKRDATPVDDEKSTQGKGNAEDTPSIIDERLGLIDSRSPCPVLSYPIFSSFLVKTWNEFADRFGLVRILAVVKGSTREKLLKARMDDPDFDIVKILKLAEDQPLLLGQSKLDTPWAMMFDWMIRPSNYIKIIEGQFRDRKPKPKGDRVGESPKRKWTEEERKRWRASAEKEIRKNKISESVIQQALKEWDRDHPQEKP